MSVDVFVGLGSNLEEPLDQLRRAFKSLASLPDSSLRAGSSIYVSPPFGPEDQPDYLNAVVWLETRLDPHTLLTHLQRIESAQGRRRDGERWGARTLDLDLLLFGSQTLQGTRLTIPHPEMAKRPFVLYPLAEIAAHLEVPGLGSLAELLDQHPDPGTNLLVIEEELAQPDSGSA